MCSPWPPKNISPMFDVLYFWPILDGCYLGGFSVPPRSIFAKPVGRVVLLQGHIDGHVVADAIFVIVQILRRDSGDVNHRVVRIRVKGQEAHAKHLHTLLKDAVKRISLWNHADDKGWRQHRVARGHRTDPIRASTCGCRSR